MKVILISPPNSFDKSPSLPSLTLATLSGILKKHHVEHICIDGNLMPSFESYKQNGTGNQVILQEMTEQIMNYRPDLVCLSVWGVSIPFAFKLAEQLKKKKYQMEIMVGGIRDIYTARYILNTATNIDYVFVGEAESNFPQFLQHFKHGHKTSKIAGVYSRSFNDIVKTAPVESDFSVTPNYDRFLNADTRSQFVETSRGCIYQCVFCGLHYTPYRRLTPQKAVEHIRDIKHKYNVEYINFADNFFPMKGRWISQFLKLLAESEIKIYWSCLIRADNIDKAIIKKLKPAGCVGVFMGVESTDNETLALMKKSRSPERYIQQLSKNIGALAEQGINTKVSTIIGFPGETKKSMWSTARFVKNLKEKGVDAYTGPLVIYPGSALWEKYIRGEIKLNKIQQQSIKRNQSGMFHECYPPDPIISPNDFIPENHHMSQTELESQISDILTSVG